MRIKRARVNCVVWNKVNNGMYRVSELKPDEGKAVLVPYDMDSCEDIPESTPVIMDELNDICFRLISDPNKPDIPEGFHVENGILYKSGDPATEQGTLVFKDILCVQPGRVILSAKTKDAEEGVVDIFAYDPWRDRFVKIGYRLPEELKHYLGYSWDEGPDVKGNDLDVYTFYASHMETVKEEGHDPVTREKLDTSGILVIHDGVVNSIYLQEGIAKLYDAENAGITVFKEPGGVNILFKGKRPVDEDGFVREEFCDKYFVLEVGRGVKDWCHVRNGRTLDFHEIAAVGYCHLESNAGIVFFGDCKILAEGFDMELPQDIFERICEEKAAYLVDIRVTSFETEIVLSDEHMEHLLRINSKKTMDRGYITTIK